MKTKSGPRLTSHVLDGVVAACASALAGPVGDEYGGDFTDEDGENMEKAMAWAQHQRELWVTRRSRIRTRQT
jgi:hypothetical protein